MLFSTFFTIDFVGVFNCVLCFFFLTNDTFLSHESEVMIDLGFEYINTSSTKWIYNIIKELSVMQEIFSDFMVTWYYEI